MSNVTLLPRLRQIAVDHLLDEYGEDLSLTSSLDFVSKSPETMSYAPSGGSPLGKESLAEIRRLLVTAAEKGGFPADGSTKSRAQFDSDVTILLGEHPLFTPPEVLRDDVWAFITTVVAPDIVSWRFGTSSRERYHGGVRNAFQRLWMRAWSLDRGVDSESRWGLIEDLTEDAFIQIVERPSIGGDPRIALALAEGWGRTAERTGRGAMEAIMRRAVVAFRLRNQVQILAALDHLELAKAVDEVFERARLSLNVESRIAEASSAKSAGDRSEDPASGVAMPEERSAATSPERRGLSRLRDVFGRKGTSSHGSEQTAIQEQGLASQPSPSGTDGMQVERDGVVADLGATGAENWGTGTFQTDKANNGDELEGQLDQLLGQVAPETHAEEIEQPINGQRHRSSESQNTVSSAEVRVAVGEEEISFEAMVTYLHRIEVAAAGRNMLSPKSRDALSKLKSGDLHLSATDMNALQNLQINLSRISVSFDIPRKAVQASSEIEDRE